MSDETKVTLKQTKGSFELRGKLFGLKAEKAYKETTTKNNKPMRFLNFGVRVSATENVYLSLSAMEPDEVWFSKVGKKGDKPVTEKMDYAKAKRNDFERDGWKLIGMGLALHKNEETGKNEDVKVYPQYDAIEEIMDNAKDGTSVFVKGTVEFGSYEDDKNEVKKTVKYVPTAIYLTKDEIDFEDEKFEKYSEFVQPVIYRGVNRNESEDKVVTYSLDVASINYKDYQEFSLPCTETIAKLFKEKKFKPYCKINLTGHLANDQIVEVVEDEDDSWGEKSKMNKPKNFAKTVLMVTGADKDSINTEEYNAKTIEAYRIEVETEKAAKKNKSAGSETQEGGDWGKKGKIGSESGWDD